MPCFRSPATLPPQWNHQTIANSGFVLLELKVDKARRVVSRGKTMVVGDDVPVKLLGGNGDGQRFFQKGELESGRSREIEIA